MASFRLLVISIIMAVAVIWGFLSFGVVLVLSNSPEKDLNNSPVFSKLISNMSTNLNSVQGEFTQAGDTFSNSSVQTTTSSGIVVDAVPSIWKTFKNVAIDGFNAIGVFIIAVLSNPAIALFLGIIGAIIVLTIVIVVWKMLSTGDGG